MLGIRLDRRLIFSFFIIPLTLWSNLVEPTIAQPTTSVCQPPQENEYLLFILTETRATYEDIRATLPPQLPTNFCQYLNDTVVRVGGFNKLLDAQGWARYFNEIVGLSAFVIQASMLPAACGSAGPATSTLRYGGMNGRTTSPIA